MKSRAFFRRAAASACCACLACIATGCDPSMRDPEELVCSDRVDTSLHPRADVFAQTLEDAVAGRVPGAVWAVRDRDGLWIGAAGFADLDLGVKMRACQRFRVASVTKSMVATAALRLAERGELTLEGPLSDRLPERWAEAFDDPRLELRDLLRHRSGLPRFRDMRWGLEVFDDPGRTWTTADFLARAAGKDREFEPGTRYSYSNTNYLLTGEAIEHVTGVAHDEVLAREVLTVANMLDASYAADDPRAFEPALASGYLDVWGDHRLYDATRTFAVTDSTAAGGVVATALDLQRFIDALLRDGELLRPETLERMLELGPTGDPEFPGYGLGIESWATPWGLGLGHTGQRFGYLSRVHWFPERDVTMVLLVNASSLASPTQDNLTGLVYRELAAELLEVAMTP